VGHAQRALELLRLKRQALKDLLEHFRHAGVYGQPELPANNLTINNMTVVPLERLTDEELEFYRVLCENSADVRSPDNEGIDVVGGGLVPENSAQSTPHISNR